ncbi:hypothetical protein TNIN_422431 [Trichonephila inaurata madagascariensis]|uniref:Uncharacterized protein n=1 Tax=Trichonephila inaurata madagascariensis TaxID=2747483 RepID=A0A8X6YB36_9ARAC|nr:hypothetical protein TNIN_422431 [Trichonephila inaurata madagascariensis]
MSSSDSSESNCDMKSDIEEFGNDFESDSGSNTIIFCKILGVISDSSNDDEVTTSTSDGDIIDEFLPVDTIFSNESNSFLKYLVQNISLLLMRNKLNTFQ